MFKIILAFVTTICIFSGTKNGALAVATFIFCWFLSELKREKE